MSEYIFKLPDLGEGTVESEIGEWFINVGDLVNEEDVVGTMMTDKAAVELASPVTGRVVKLAGEPGDIVAVGAALVVFETDADAPVEAEPVEEAPSDADTVVAKVITEAEPVEEAPRNGAHLERSRVITSPAIRRRAKEAGVDLAAVPGSGPGGRILRIDFDRYVERADRLAPVPMTEASPATKEIKVIGLRRMIAERMSASKREIPHFAYVEEMDITELEALRKHLNESRDSSNRLTLLPFLGMALIRALKEFPQCNATYDKERGMILQHGAVHLGVATQTPDGLKVPVVRNAEIRTLDSLSAEIRRVTTAAKDGSAKRDELSGSTITITSLGKLGGIVSTPVINMPEVGIIGVNRAVERPVVVDGQIAVRLMMKRSSSFDHRFVDGDDAAAMIQRIRQMLEHPATIFIDD